MYNFWRKKHPMLKKVKNFMIDLPTPSNMFIWWNFGSILGLCLMTQIITGLFLSMHYTADVKLAFSSVSHICRDVKYGWLLRNTHANSASLFFCCLYIHMGRGLYYGSFLKKEAWNIGVILFAITMLTAFVGYVLPWGQMSFWGATVITKLLSATPYMGKTLVQWIWGGFSMGKATLTRFFTFHFLFPFLLMVLTILHLMFIHNTGAKNPSGLNSNLDKIPFHSFFTSKDLVGFILFFIVLMSLSLLFPNLLTDPEKFSAANPLLTPIHIQPEWYFLFAYAILRSMPNKLGGVLALVSSILILFLIPLIHKSKKTSMMFRPLSQLLFWVSTSKFFLLTYMGGCPVENPFMLVGQISSCFYFLKFIMFQPLLSNLEKKFT